MDMSCRWTKHSWFLSPCITCRSAPMLQMLPFWHSPRRLSRANSSPWPKSPIIVTSSDQYLSSCTLMVNWWVYKPPPWQPEPVERSNGGHCPQRPVSCTHYSCLRMLCTFITQHGPSLAYHCIVEYSWSQQQF